MNFRNRLLLGNVLIIAVFVAAVVVANQGLRGTAERFARFLDGVGVLQQAYQGMYSQGLQMGQALRNIVLDPANPRAYENLGKARQDFASARDRAELAVGAVEDMDGSLGRLLHLIDAHGMAQAEVLAALKSGRVDEARDLINSKETPAWRTLKKALLDDLEGIRHATATQREALREETRRIETVSLVLSLLAVIVALVSVVMMLAYVRRELGGDPGHARALALAVAAGDLTRPIAVAGDNRDSLLGALAVMQTQLRHLAGALAGHAGLVEQTAGEMAASTRRVASGGVQQLAEVEAMMKDCCSMAESLRATMAAIDHPGRIMDSEARLSSVRQVPDTRTMSDAIQSFAEISARAREAMAQMKAASGDLREVVAAAERLEALAARLTQQLGRFRF